MKTRDRKKRKHPPGKARSAQRNRGIDPAADESIIMNEKKRKKKKRDWEERPHADDESGSTRKPLTR